MSKPSKKRRVESCSCCGRDAWTTREPGVIVLCSVCEHHGGGLLHKDIRTKHANAEWDSMTVDGEGAVRRGCDDDFWELVDRDD